MHLALKQFVCIAAFMATALANALPHRTVGLEFMFGIPQVAAAAATVRIWKRVQIGFGYTYVPPNQFIGQTIELDEQQLEFADGNTYTTEPEVTPSAAMMAPFIRFFPAEDNFYIHASYTFIQASAKIEGTFRNDAGPIPIFLGGALMTGSLRIRQFLPTAGVGYIWSGEHFFFNLSIGGTLFGNITVKSNVEIILPEEVGGLIANEAVLTALNTELKSQLKAIASEALTGIRTQFPFIPSLQFSFGFFF